MIDNSHPSYKAFGWRFFMLKSLYEHLHFKETAWKYIWAKAQNEGVPVKASWSGREQGIGWEIRADWREWA